MKIIIALFTLLVPASSFTQQSSIDWYKVSGGGGTSSGGQYTVGGTIGQHEAGGPMSGGNYSLTGGFWSLYATQTPGAPALRIFLTTTNTAVVAWPAPSTGFTLQHNGNPANPSGWLDSGGGVNVVGPENQVIISPPLTGAVFFRLKN